MYGFFLYQFWHVLRGVTTNETFKWDSTRAKQREQFKYAFRCFGINQYRKSGQNGKPAPLKNIYNLGAIRNVLNVIFPPSLYSKRHSEEAQKKRAKSNSDKAD